MINSKSLAEKIIEKDPNGLVILDNDIKIVHFNKAFLSIFDITPTHKIIGENVNTILKQEFFPDSKIEKDSGLVIEHHKTGRFVKVVTFRLEEEKLVACFFVDVTDYLHNKRTMQLMKTETMKKAQAVIDNQMRVAQEIASLLGETTAESKVTLLQLMDILKEEGEI